MLQVFPLKFRPSNDGLILFSNDAGGYFKSTPAFLDRYVREELNDDDRDFLWENGHAFDERESLEYAGFEHRFASRLYVPDDLDYIILVPTLRCNLACGYCQVSRVNSNTPGFDWSEDTLAAVLSFLGGLSARRIKVEFQGGEPLLRLDIIQQVINFCRSRFKEAEFVICTNLQDVNVDAWRLFGDEDVFISTSLDSDPATHQEQRTGKPDVTEQFFANLERAMVEFGPGKVSALPTLNASRPPEPLTVIDSYASYGMQSIYLRPVNYQGFARKRFDARQSAERWNVFHMDFIDALIDYNWTAHAPMEEYYFVHCLRRVLRAGHNGHVDLRNPNILGRGYLVVDHDGRLYPTDEARMVSRVGQFDLSMGSVLDGPSLEVVHQLNSESSNNFHPDCVHCPYQPFCGVDLVDDLSRYGRIDVPKHLTDFCKRHLRIFDKIFELIYSPDPRVRKSMALWAGVPRFSEQLAVVHI